VINLSNAARALPLAPLFLLLAGCSAAFWRPRPVPFAEPQTELVLRQPVHFPAGTTRVYFQKGRAVTQRQLSVWDHHCALAIDRALDSDIDVPAAPITVVRTQRRSTVGEWGQGVITYESSFYFSADAWPLYALYCELWTQHDGYNHLHHLTAGELAEVLGSWAFLAPQAIKTPE